jgi:hypothetical protein
MDFNIFTESIVARTARILRCPEAQERDLYELVTNIRPWDISPRRVLRLNTLESLVRKLRGIETTGGPRILKF